MRRLLTVHIAHYGMTSSEEVRYQRLLDSEADLQILTLLPLSSVSTRCSEKGDDKRSSCHGGGMYQVPMAIKQAFASSSFNFKAILR